MSAQRKQQEVHERLIGRTIARWLEDRAEERDLSPYDASTNCDASKPAPSPPPAPALLEFRPTGPSGANRVATEKMRAKWRGRRTDER